MHQVPPRAWFPDALSEQDEQEQIRTNRSKSRSRAQAGFPVHARPEFPETADGRQSGRGHRHIPEATFTPTAAGLYLVFFSGTGHATFFETLDFSGHQTGNC